MLKSEALQLCTLMFSPSSLIHLIPLFWVPVLNQLLCRCAIRYGASNSTAMAFQRTRRGVTQARVHI